LVDSLEIKGKADMPQEKSMTPITEMITILNQLEKEIATFVKKNL